MVEGIIKTRNLENLLLSDVANTIVRGEIRAQSRI